MFKFRNSKRLVYINPLQFPDPTPMNATTSASEGNNLTAEMKTFYDTNLIDLVSPALVHDQFGDKVTIPKNHGLTIEFRGYEPLDKALTPLTEGVTPAGEKLDVYTVTATLKQYGAYAALTDVLQMAAVDNNVLQAQEALGDQAGRTLDTVTREAINAGTNVQYGEGTKTSRAALDATDLLTPKAIAMAVRTLKKKSAPKINGKYCGIINQDVAYDLQQSEDYKDLFRYTDNSSFKNGYVFNLSGVEFYESPEAKIWSGAGAEGRDVYSTLILGAHAYAVTNLAGATETIVKTLGSAGTADPLNQRSTVGWKSTKAVAILTQQYMVRIETCSKFNDHEAN